MKEREEEVFRIIREKLKKFSFPESSIVKNYISPEIEKHPAYTMPYYAGKSSPSEVYDGRYNLLYFIDNRPSDKGNNTALNAHIDVVSPFFPPRMQGDYIYGRGTIDDKGNVSVIYGSLFIIDKLLKERKIELKNSITAMFVIDEETGGNGSLNVAINRDLRKRYNSILILEVASNNIYPANRGAVWFKCELKWKNNSGNYQVTPSLLEAMIFSILEIENEGERIKEESNHPLFPHRPVQTCNGILGPFGEHPSRICGKVSFILRGIKDKEKLMNAIEIGLNKYIKKYGDKTKVINKETGERKVDHHFDIKFINGKDAIINIYGSTGHMGSIKENDDAICKWAYIAREILEFKLKENIYLKMELENFDSSQNLTLEGGQGFLPTHEIEEIQERIRNSAVSGVKKYLNLLGIDEDVISCNVTYDKLHNSAFEGNPYSPSVKTALNCGIDAGIISRETPLRGWDVSCDARLFAKEYPDLPVITSGVGELKYAHSDNEHIFIPDLFKAILFTTLFLLRETGSI